jgi:two-component system sensor histidine kinase KdpD
LSAGGVAIITFAARRVVPVNPTTVGFAYLLLILIVASTWGFAEASVSSVLATLAYNFFFLPPVGQFTIADPQNWVALFTFLATSLIASRLSDKAKHRATDAVERQQDLERLYTFSRAILLMSANGPLPKQLAQKLAEVFALSAVVLYDRRADEMYRAGPSDFDGLEDQLREAALNGTSFADPERNRVITAVRLGSEPIASLAFQGSKPGPEMPDLILQGISNLVAIGLERAKAQDLTRQIEVARQSEQLRTTLIDAMAHEFKTPLTSIKAATTSLLADPGQPSQSRMELLTIANEEADHLQELIDNAVDMARLDIAHIDVDLEASDLAEAVNEVVASMHSHIDGRPIEVISRERLPPLAFDRRLVKLAIKQLLDNALKYSPTGTPVTIDIERMNGSAAIDVTNQGQGIPVQEQRRIFERFYRSPSVRRQVPGSGLGLTIAHQIARAHNGDLTVASHPGKTTFRMSLPAPGKADVKENGQGEQN